MYNENRSACKILIVNDDKMIKLNIIIILLLLLFSSFSFFHFLRLSERNCVELIGLLVKEGLLNVIYTTDGKDIITEQRLIREILDEIYANGGTISFNAK
jgi:hypothetical protein